MKTDQRHTIAAVSTAPGKGAIAIVRLSGENSENIAEKMLGAKKHGYDEIKRYTLTTRNIKDDVTAVFYKAPKSYTGEDSVEIFCHGNNAIAEEIVKECIRLGARPAENGEFTKRAFLNGKIDLTQAEGVIDIINAESRAGINAAFDAVEGGIFKETERIRKEILSLNAEAGVAVDYPEEDVEETTAENLLAGIEKAGSELKKIADSYDAGRIIKDGVKVAIAGEANVGKSSLLNKLLGRDRAIVTDTEGTTRDTLEENFEYNGIKFLFIDTAGLRDTDDEVEKCGIERSYKAIESADIVLSVFDANKKPAKIEGNNKKIIRILNKTDVFGEKTNEKCDIKISAKTGENIEKLKKLIFDISCENVSAGGVIITNARQFDAVTKALNALKRAKQSAENMTFDCIISDLNAAYRELGSLTGSVASDDIVNEIFSRFCVGK